MSTRLKKRFKAPLIGMSLLCLTGVHGIAAAQSETEPNDTKAQSHPLVVTSSGTTVSGYIGAGAGSLTTDLDLYSFEARAGDVPNIAIVSDGTWDTFLGLYDSAGNLLEMNDDAYPMNAGSSSAMDSRIDTYRIAADGVYYVAVTPIPRYLGANYSVINTSSTYGGAYDLTLQGVTPSVPPVSEAPSSQLPPPAPVPAPVPVPDSPAADATVVTIEVRHWSRDDDEPENRRYRKLIPVAILSSADFNAMDIDRNSLAFGATGSEDSLARCRKRGKDVNRDGKRDLVCYFKTELTGFQVGDVQGFLNGTTVKGEAFQGSAALKIFRLAKEKREGWHERHRLNPRQDRERMRVRHERRDDD